MRKEWQVMIAVASDAMFLRNAGPIVEIESVTERDASRRHQVFALGPGGGGGGG